MYGTTNYTYLTGPTAADANALATIAYADNTHVYYSYDAKGGSPASEPRRRRRRRSLTPTVPVGGYTVTNADNDATTILADDMGLVAETIDPLGNITRYTYDADSELDQHRRSRRYDHDLHLRQPGQPHQRDRPARQRDPFTYDPTFSQLLSSTDPRGYTTTYAIDANGNVTSVTSPDGERAAICLQQPGRGGAVRVVTIIDDGLIKIIDGLSSTRRVA